MQSGVERVESGMQQDAGSVCPGLWGYGGVWVTLGYVDF